VLIYRFLLTAPANISACEERFFVVVAGFSEDCDEISALVAED